MDADQERMPGDAEAAAAGRALHEQTPSGRVYAVGDFVSGVSGGKPFSGRVEAIDGDRVTVDEDGVWTAVSVAEITY